VLWQSNDRVERARVAERDVADDRFAVLDDRARLREIESPRAEIRDQGWVERAFVEVVLDVERDRSSDSTATIARVVVKHGAVKSHSPASFRTDVTPSSATSPAK
jgi:hypothetical protein